MQNRPTVKLLLFLMMFFILFSAPAAFAARKSTGQQPKASQPRTAESSEEDEAANVPVKSSLPVLSKVPYSGAILLDASTGKVLFEDNADVKGYPASVIKLMNLLIILEAVEKRQIGLQEMVFVSAEASKTGGSQVYLKEHEAFTVDEMLYALMVQSANDAAVALALHIAGSKEGFIDLMNRRAKELGMNNTVINSVHGLPPGKGQQPDISTPRDIATLCMEIVKHNDALRYTSTKERSFRDGSFMMRNHNHLIGNFEGCDGLKTGYFRAAGYSVAATASKRGGRAIAVIFGSVNSKTRDAKARELLSKGVTELAQALPPPAPPVSEQAVAAAPKADTEAAKSDVVQISKKTLKIIGIAIVGLIVLLAIVSYLKNKRSSEL